MKVPKKINSKSLKMCHFIGRSHSERRIWHLSNGLCVFCTFTWKVRHHTTTNETECNCSPLKWVFNLFPILITLFSGLIAVIHTETKSWTINVPPLIKGLPGSCVVIPCSFDFPDQKKKPTQFTGMWKDANNQFIYHPNDSKIMRTYWNRTRLLGNLRQKDCSLGIDPLNHSDQGPFHFRIEIAKLDKFSYTQNTVSISKIGKSSNAVFYLRYYQPSARLTLKVVLWMLQMNWAPCFCLSRGRWGMVRPPRYLAPSPTSAPRLLPSSPGVTWDWKAFSTRRLSTACWGQHLPWASSLPGETTTSPYGAASDTRVGSSKKQDCFSKWCVSMWSQLIWENTERKLFFLSFFLFLQMFLR